MLPSIILYMHHILYRYTPFPLNYHENIKSTYCCVMCRKEPLGLDSYAGIINKIYSAQTTNMTIYGNHIQNILITTSGIHIKITSIFLTGSKI